MKRWGRRLAYALVALLWLVVMSFPVLAFLLAARGQVQFGVDPDRHLRLFLVQERNFEGVGVEWVRPYGEQPACTQTAVRYLMWAGEAENVSFCQCVDPLTGADLPAASQTCNAP
jgi:hypothetical protein